MFLIMEINQNENSECLLSIELNMVNKKDKTEDALMSNRMLMHLFLIAKIIIIVC